MKTKSFKYLKAVLLAALMVNLTSCEVDIAGFWDDDSIGGGYYSKSQDLCSRTWVRYYYNVYGDYCRQEVDYYLDRTGVDFIRIEYRNGGVYENEYYFNWNWENRSQTSLRMVYAPNDISYLDDVQIWGNRLTGYLDDDYVIYNGRF